MQHKHEFIERFDCFEWTIVKEIDTKKRKRVDKKVDGMCLNA